MTEIFRSVLSSLLRPGWPMLPLQPPAQQAYTLIPPSTENLAVNDAATAGDEIDEDGRRCGWDYAENNTKVDRKDLAELLDCLDGTFKSARRQYDRLSWADQDTIAGLKKMGIHIPYPWFVQKGQTDPLNPAEIPALMSLSIGNTAHDNDDGTDIVHPECMFAQRLPRLPPGIELVKGTPYQFGMAFPFAKSGLLFWMTCWLVIKPDGMVRLCRELRRESCDIKSHRHQGMKRVPTERWNHPAMTMMDESPNRLSQASHETFIKGLFYSMVRWWQMRDRRWSIIVTKDSQRVTFGIHRRMTAEFFKDRQKTVITATGRTRKIFHYVQEHTRSNGSFVRAHTRGQREFDWNGYHCKIMAPEFDGRTAGAFTLPPVDEEEAMPRKRYLDAQELGQLLGDHEAIPNGHRRDKRRRRETPRTTPL